MDNIYNPQTPQQQSKIKKKITIGGSSVTRMQSQNQFLGRRVSKNPTGEQLNKIPMKSKQKSSDMTNNPQSRGGFLSTGSQSHRLFVTGHEDTMDFYLPDVKQRQQALSKQQQNRLHPKVNIQSTPKHHIPMTGGIPSPNPPLTQIQVTANSSQHEIQQQNGQQNTIREVSSRELTQRQRMEFYQEYLALQQEVKSQTARGRSNNEDSQRGGNSKLLQQFQPIKPMMLKNNMFSMVDGSNSGDSNSHRFSNMNFKAFTPKITKQVKIDSKQVNLLSQKSYAKIFEPTTFIAEDEDSYEDEVAGIEAKILFYKKSKNLHKMIDKSKDSPFLKFLQKCNNNHLVPQPLGLLNPKRMDRNNIQTQGFKMGDGYAQALGESLQRTTNQPTIINLSVNRLSDKGAIPILNSIQPSTLELDISTNPSLNFKSYAVIGQILQQPQFKLQILKLERNNIGDAVCRQLCDSLTENLTLSYLNLNNNSITDIGAKSLADLIKTTTTLKVLFISWNKIKHRGGCDIADSLTINASIQILDISFNSFGTSVTPKLNLMMLTPKIIDMQSSQSSMPMSPNQQSIILNDAPMKQQLQSETQKTAHAFKNMFMKNKTLIHVDLSHNGLMNQELDIISEGLKENHTILGLHMIGNQRNTDAMGYVTQRDFNTASSHIMTRLKPTLDMGQVNKSKMKLQTSSNCWICEGWTQVMFQFNPMKTIHKDLDEFTPVYIHISCDNFAPDLMERNSDGIYRLLRMIPPGNITYYFTIHYEGSTEPLQVWGHDQKHRDTTMGEKVDQRDLKIPVTNIIDNILQSTQPVTQTMLEDLTFLIRPPPKEPPSRAKEKEPWDFKKSVFAQYIPDSEALLNQCFDFDWDCSKITKVVKDYDEQLLVKEYLRKNYKHIRECYKYFAAISPNNGTFCIGQLIFQEVINNTAIVDRENLANNDVDLEFITTNAGVKQHQYNPDRGLVRYQMMELFVRLAVQKYFKSKIVDTMYEAITRMFDNELLKYLKNFDCHVWRKTILWTESCDIVYKAYMPVIKILYKKNSGRFAKPGQTPFMSLDEFQELITQGTGIGSESFGQREVGIHFNLSKMTEVNEVDNNKHMKMQLVEFIEAIGRIADKLNIEALKKKVNFIPSLLQFGLEDSDEEGDVGVTPSATPSKKQDKPSLTVQLSTKLEFLLKILMSSLNQSANDKAMRNINKQIENNIKKTSLLNVIGDSVKKQNLSISTAQTPKNPREKQGSFMSVMNQLAEAKKNGGVPKNQEPIEEEVENLLEQDKSCSSSSNKSQ